MKYIDNLKVEEFDGFAYNHQLNSIFQSSKWAKTKNNWQAEYVGVLENGKLVAASLILLRKLPGGLKFAYLPRGPLMDYNNLSLVSFFFTNLKKQLKNDNVILAKFDPNIIYAQLNFNDKNEVRNLKDDKLIETIVRSFIIHCGYTLSIKDSIQPRIQLDICTENFDNIILSKTMKKIRASKNKGVIVKNVKHNVEDLIKMINHTQDRHHINLRNKSYFTNLINNFGNDACIFSAYYEENLISSCLLVKCKDTCEILYSGYDDNYKKYNSTYLLRYEAIKFAKESGCKYFSFGGVEGSLDDGLTTFKSSFNPTIKLFIGEFDILPFFGLSKIVSVLFPMLKKKVKF